MQKSFREVIEHLTETNLTLRRKLETAEATIPVINTQIRQIAALGLASGLVFTGDVIQTVPYLPDSGISDSAQCFQAVLIIPEGIGAAVWDVCEYAQQQRLPEGTEPEVANRFVPFDSCTNLLKALLVSQAHDLLQQLMSAIPMRLH